MTVPTYRPDVTRPADLVEEIARLHGYDEFPSRLPKGVGEGLPVWERRRRLVRRALVGAGCFEVLTFSFQGPDEIEALGLPEGDPRRALVRVRNPLSEEQSCLRTSLIPGLLHGAAGQRGAGPGGCRPLRDGPGLLPILGGPARPAAAGGLRRHRAGARSAVGGGGRGARRP